MLKVAAKGHTTLMHPDKETTPQKVTFTDEQIRLKAYQIWQNQVLQNHPVQSADDNWAAAIRVLEREWRFRHWTAFWRWTGFGEKKGLEILQVFLIPILLLIGSQIFTSQNNAQQRQTAKDNANQATLVEYLDEMADLLDVGLIETKQKDETFIRAQAKTVIALQSLDPKRQHLVVQFLDAANLSTFPNKSIGLLHDAKMSKANLSEAEFGAVHLIKADLIGANLIGANLNGAYLNGARLIGADLSGAKLSNVDLSNADLSGTDLTKVNLSSAYLNGTKLIGANLSGQDLSNVDLSGVKLIKADLSNTKLIGADLIDADFTGANLIGADLSNADLTGANLTGTKLIGADLSRAILFLTNLLETTNLASFQLKGKEPPLICRSLLPQNIEIDLNRDCEKVAAALLKRSILDLSSLDKAEKYMCEFPIPEHMQSESDVPMMDAKHLDRCEP